MQRGLRRIRIVLALSLLAAWAAPAAAQPLLNPEAWMQLDRDPAVQRAFARDLRAGLVAVRLDPSDINDILRPLIAAGIVRAVSGPDAAAGLHSQSLETISNRRRALFALSYRLRDKYGIVELRSAVSDWLGLPDDAPVRHPPAMNSWLTFRTYRLISNFPAARADFAERRPEPEPLKWITPLRIAATGNALADQAIAAALVRLRAVTPGLPIDAASFPAPLDRANMIVMGPSVICPAGEACHRAPPGSVLAQAQRALEVEAASIHLEPLFVFGALRGDRWLAGPPIYRVWATVGKRGVAAWIRTDGHGHIGTASCNYVIGFISDDHDRNHRKSVPARFKDMTATIEACIAAALGAPTDLSPNWFKDQFQKGLQPADQHAILRHLYAHP